MPILTRKLPIKPSQCHLSRHQEVRLIEAAQAGDLAARNELIERHYGMICWHTIKTVGSEFADDYYALAVEAAIDAAAKFDTKRPVRFMTYAGQAIWRRVYRQFITSGIIRKPVRPENGTTRRSAASRHMASLDAPRGHDDHATLYSFIRGEETRWIETEHHRHELEQLRFAISELGEQMTAVVQLRLEGLTQQQVGLELGVSHQRVQQIEVEAMAVLRALLVGARDTDGRDR